MDEAANAERSFGERQSAYKFALPRWKWHVLRLALFLSGFMNGYDICNVANIQSQLYSTFGHIESLPWVGAAFAIGVAAMWPFFRQLLQRVNMKWVLFITGIIFLAGAAMSGAANSMQVVILGRFLNSIGGGGLLQVSFAYITLLGGSSVGVLHALTGVGFAIGVISGPLIGAAFAQNPHATWRWAFYLLIPLYGTILGLLLLCYPSYKISKKGKSGHTLLAQVRYFDLVGVVLHISAVATFCMATLFSGPVFPWSSGSSIALWVCFVLIMACYISQQRWCILVDPESRAFPVETLQFPVVTFAAIGCMSNMVAYVSGLYYLPLFYAFSHGYSTLDAAVRLLPNLCVMILFIILSGALLPKVKSYVLWYFGAGILILIGSALLATDIGVAARDVSKAMGFSAILGAGVGLFLQYGYIMANLALPPELKYDGNSLIGIAQYSGVTLGLSVLGAIYQNRGFTKLKGAIGQLGFSDHDIREALAGQKSRVWQTGNQNAKQQAVRAVTQTIMSMFYFPAAAGALCCFIGFYLMFIQPQLLEARKKRAERDETDAMMLEPIDVGPG